jgi:pectate lyase
MMKKYSISKKVLVLLVFLFMVFLVTACNKETTDPRIEELESRIEELEKANQTIQARLDELTLAKTNILGAIETLLSKESSQEARLAALETAKGNMEKQIDNLSDLSGTSQADILALIENLTTQIEHLTSNQGEIENYLLSLGVSIENLQAFASSTDLTINQYGTDIETINSQLSSLGETLSEATSNIGNLEDKIEALEASDALIGQQIVGINNEILSINGTFEVIDGKFTNIDGQIIDIGNSLLGIDGSISNIGTTLDGLNGSITLINGNITSLNTTVTTLSNNVSGQIAGILTNLADLMEDLNFLYIALYEPYINPYGFASLNAVDFSEITPIEVHDEIEFLIALKNATGASAGAMKSNMAIKLMANMDMGYIEMNQKAVAKGYASATAITSAFANNAVPRQHPKLIATGVGKYTLRYAQNILIYSEEGYAIRHINFTVNNVTNIIFRNISFEELWEWDESSRGMFNDLDWDYFTLTGGAINGFWIDHCSFQNSYDGIIDGGGTGNPSVKNLTVSWTELRSHRNAFIQQQIEDLDMRLSTLESTNTRYPKFWAEIRQKINNTPQLTLDNVVEFFASIKKGFNLGNSGSQGNYNYSDMTITYHHVWAENIQERFLRLRKADAHMYNVFNDGTSLNEMLPYFHFENMSMAPTEGSNIVLENSYFKGIDDPVRTNQNMGTDLRFTGKFHVINSIYELEDYWYQGDSHTGNDPWVTSSNRYDDLGYYFRNYKELPYNYQDHMVGANDVKSLLTGGSVGAGKLRHFNWQFITPSLGWDGTFKTDYKIDNTQTFNASSPIGRLDQAMSSTVTRISVGGTYTPLAPTVYNFYNNLHDGKQSSTQMVKNTDYTLEVNTDELDNSIPGFYTVTYIFTNLHDYDDVVYINRTVQVVNTSTAIEIGSYTVSPVRDGYVNVSFTSINPSSNNAAKASNLYVLPDEIARTNYSDVETGILLNSTAATSGTYNQVYVGANDYLNLVVKSGSDRSSVIAYKLDQEEVVHISSVMEFKMQLFKNATKGKYFILDNDIDFTGESNKVSEVSTFYGTLDGNGHKVKNLTTSGFGLFRVIDGASIKNITFDNVHIDQGNDSAAAFLSQSLTGIVRFENVHFFHSSERSYIAAGGSMLSATVDANAIVTISNMSVIGDGDPSTYEVNALSNSGGLFATLGATVTVNITDLYFYQVNVESSNYGTLGTTAGLLFGTIVATDKVTINRAAFVDCTVGGTTNLGGLVGAGSTTGSATFSVSNVYLDFEISHKNAAWTNTGIITGSTTFAGWSGSILLNQPTSYTNFTKAGYTGTPITDATITSTYFGTNMSALTTGLWTIDPVTYLPTFGIWVENDNSSFIDPSQEGLGYGSAVANPDGSVTITPDSGVGSYSTFGSTDKNTPWDLNNDIIVTFNVDVSSLEVGQYFIWVLAINKITSSGASHCNELRVGIYRASNGYYVNALMGVADDSSNINSIMNGSLVTFSTTKASIKFTLSEELVSIEVGNPFGATLYTYSQAGFLPVDGEILGYGVRTLWLAKTNASSVTIGELHLSIV